MHMAIEQTDVRPWYRQFWPWFIMALPLAAVIAGLTTVAIAVTHQDSVVRDDWYTEGKSINQDIARDSRATTLGINADIRSDAVTGEIHVRLQHNAQSFTAPDTLTLYFSHPTLASADQQVQLKRQGDDYRGQLARGLKGRYYVELGTPHWRLQGSREFPRDEFSLTHD